jgi:non-specific protein-tyrosine kinase
MKARVNALGLNLGLYLYQATRWVVLAVIPAVVVATAGYVYGKHQPKTYQSTATLYVQQSAQTGTGLSGSTDPYSSGQLAANYTQMVTDPTIVAAADAALQKKYPGFAIRGVSAAQRPGQQASQLFSESVTDTNPVRAADAANAVAALFIRRIKAIQIARFTTDERNLSRQLSEDQKNVAALEGRINAYTGTGAGLQALRAELTAYQTTYQTLFSALVQFRATRDASLNDVSVYSPATAGTLTGPHPTRNAALAGFLALLVCGGLLFAYDYFNDLARTPEDLEAAAGAPVLGTVQDFDAAHLGTPLVVRKHPHSPASEAYRLIRTNIQFTNVDHPPRSIVVTSALPAEGKSTTVSNLAQVFAEVGTKVTLVDADLRRPSLHRVFPTQAGRREGLTTMLASPELNGRGAQDTDLANLGLVASGPVPPNPADLLGSERMRAVLEHMERRDGIVLLDTPPVLAVADAAILASMVDGVVLVVDPHRVKRREVRRAREAIEAVGGKVIGLVMNRLRPRGAIYYYYYGSYGYKHGYKYGYGTTPRGEPEPAAKMPAG